MSKLIPLAALIPNPKHAASVICPPYDVIDSKEARAFAEGNPCSFLHITKPEIDLPPETDPYSDEVYQKAVDNLARFRKDGILIEDGPSYYVYRLTKVDHVQTGIVCCVSADEYENGLIKRHELTREEKVIDRTKHAYTINAHSEPVLLVHRASDSISKLIADTVKTTALYEVTDNAGVKHTLWRATNAKEIEKAFAELDALYIADGHHRSAVSAIVRDKMKKDNPSHDGTENYNFFPAVVFPHDELKIFEYDWDGDPAKRPLAKVTIEDVMEIADKKEIMPPKSTWFDPKLGSGLFMHIF